MPLYEYCCPIHNIFDVQQKITDEPLILCPHCQENNIETPIKKLISISSFHLAGQGWARDNYSK